MADSGGWCRSQKREPANSPLFRANRARLPTFSHASACRRLHLNIHERALAILLLSLTSAGFLFIDRACLCGWIVRSFALFFAWGNAFLVLNYLRSLDARSKCFVPSVEVLNQTNPTPNPHHAFHTKPSKVSEARAYRPAEFEVRSHRAELPSSDHRHLSTAMRRGSL